MKFAKIFALVVLLGCSAVVAHADGGVDPSVKINKFPSDPPCGDPSLPAGTQCIESGQAVSIDLDGTTVFDVGGTAPITQLTLSFQGIVGDYYVCYSDIFVNCYSQETGNTVVMNLFIGGPGQCQSNGDEPTAGTCPGEILPGQTFSIEGDMFGGSTAAVLNAPEPDTYILLFGGLLALLAFSKKRQGAAFSE
ncbi:MAG: PEP-CTERM sorting domain-containing protein [Candidatus Acidiferrales bacterium]